MITKKNTFSEALLPQIMRKEGRALCIPKITLADRIDTYNKCVKYNNSLSYTTIEHNKLYRQNKDAFESMIDINLIMDDTVGLVTKSFTSQSRIQPTIELMVLNYGSAQTQRTFALHEGIYAKRIGNSYSVVAKRHVDYMDALNKDTMYVDIRTNEVIDESTVRDEYQHYSCLGNSPSGERRKMILVGSDKYDWETIIDNSSDGFLTCARGKETYASMAKKSAKLFQSLAGSVSMGKCKKIAILFDKFAEDKFDGMCYGSTESFCNRVKETFDISVSPKATEGIFLQGRIAQGKYGCILLPNYMIENKIKYLAKKRDTKPLEYTWDKMQEISKDMLANKDKYKNQIVIIGDKDEPIDILLDSNSLKSVYDYSTQPEYTVLRVLKNGSPVHFSSTIFAKAVAKDPQTARVITKKLFEYDVVKSAQKQLKSRGRVLGLDTFDKDIFMRDVLVGAFPEYVRNDDNVALDVLKNIVEAANKSVQKLGCKARGAGKGIVVGPENLYTDKSLLGEFELYNRHLIKIANELGIPDEMVKVVGFKYPTMDIDEYEIYSCITPKEINTRINKTFEGKDKLIRNLRCEYAAYQDSIAVMPCSEDFKFKHAGSDFDTDMMQFLLLVTDEALEHIKATQKEEVYKEALVYNMLYNVFKHEASIVKIEA